MVTCRLMYKILKVIFIPLFYTSNIQAQDTTFQCNPWAQQNFGPYLIENNVWGQGDINNYSQCIYTTTDSVFGWNWDWPNTGTNVKAYPEIIFGKKPWSSASTNNALPIMLDDIETFEVNFTIESEASGNCNLAFEFWVTSDSMSNENEITTEVMIWTSNSLLQPAGNQIAVVFVDGYYYNLFQADFDNWLYYAFVSNEDQFNGSLNIHNFINYMVSIGYLDPNEYLASFELGNEIVYGSGQTNIHHYSINVNETLDAISNKTKEEGSFFVYNPVPNPFNPVTIIRYKLTEQAFVKVTIYDVLGKVINTLVNKYQNVGYKSVEWNGRDNKGKLVSAGAYLYSIEAGSFKEIKKMIFLQ